MLAEQLLADEIQAAVTSNCTADCKFFGTWSLSYTVSKAPGITTRWSKEGFQANIWY